MPGQSWHNRRRKLRRTQGGCGGLGGENPAAFPQVRPIFQQPFSLPENAQTLAGLAFRATGKSVNHFPAASKFAGKLFQQGISDSHSLLEFSEKRAQTRQIPPSEASKSRGALFLPFPPKNRTIRFAPSPFSRGGKPRKTNREKDHQ